MKNKRIIFVFLLSYFSFCSCKKADFENVQSVPKTDKAVKENALLRQTFGNALGQALVNSPSLRDFIRKEALKKFDNDYDVLYAIVKNQVIEDGITFEEILSKYVNDKSFFKRIEKELPLLTMFIPELPENSFSAQLWDVNKVAPSIGVSFLHTNDVEIVEPNGNKYTLTSEKIPAFPVIVIKENERIVVSTNSNKVKLRGRTFDAGGVGYQFLDKCFDASSKNLNTNSRTTFSLDPKIIDAYNIYLGTDGWHRDYIYYGITPTSPNGQFSYNFQEHITSFSMNGNPIDAYNKISDQTGDPFKKDYIIAGGTFPPNAGWTGGAYEFKIKVLFNGKNGVGSEFITYFTAQPSELFNLHYARGVFSTYFPVIIGYNVKNLSLPLFNWDLNQYASTIKIEIEEVDQTETTTITETDNVKFATNFAIEGTVLKKIGLKFGASLEVNQTRTTTKTITQGSDLLGSVLINFADNVILRTDLINGQTRYTTRDYETGFFKLSMEPVRVQ